MARKNLFMPPGPDVFRFPLDERTADSGLVGLDAPSAPVPWKASERSSFEQPSLLGDLVRARRRRKQFRLNLALAGLLLLAALVCAAALLS